MSDINLCDPTPTQMETRIFKDQRSQAYNLRLQPYKPVIKGNMTQKIRQYSVETNPDVAL